MKYYTIFEASQRLGISERDVQRKCKAGKYQGALKEGSQWQIPETAHPKLYEVKQILKPGELAEFCKLPVHRREEAFRKIGIIKNFESFYYSGSRKVMTKSEAVEAFCRLNDLKRSTLYYWFKQFREYGPLGLVDSRGGDRTVEEAFTGEAWEYFKSLYLDQKRWSAKLCWQTINHINKIDNKGWVIPNLRSVYNHIEKNLPMPVQVLHRAGLTAYESKYSPYVLIDPESVEPGQIFVGDHHQFNCWIWHRGGWVRPWMTAWQDMRSRLIVGFDINAGPNQSTILLAAKRAFEKYGPPESVKIDNGRDYDSQMWTGVTKKQRRAITKGYLDESLVAGVYGMLNIAVSFAIPYNAKAKIIERYFDTMDRQFTKTIPTYCGKDVATRPDYLNDLLKREKVIDEAYNLEDFTGLVGQYVENIYNQQPHTGEGMGGRSPAEVMNIRPSRRVLLDGVLDLLMVVWSGELTIGKNGVRFKKLWYGQHCADLLANQGRKVRVGFDPDDVSRVYVYDSKTLKLITLAEQAELIQYGNPVSEDALREAMREQKRALKVRREFRNAQLTANTDLVYLAMKAQQEAVEIDQAEERRPEKVVGSVKPVATPLDGQVGRHKTERVKKVMRKAAGAEGQAGMEFNYDELRRTPPSQELTFEGFDF